MRPGSDGRRTMTDNPRRGRERKPRCDPQIPPGLVRKPRMDLTTPQISWLRSLASPSSHRRRTSHHRIGMTGIRESGGDPLVATAVTVAEPNAAPSGPERDAQVAGRGGVGRWTGRWIGRWGRRMPKRRPRVLTVMAVLGVLLFALWGIGGPLFGTSTLTPTDELVTNGPWVSTGFAGTVPQNTYLDDTYTSELPSEMLFKQQLDQGKVAQWNPYGAAGSALGAIPDYAFYSPLTVPFYVMPSWLAPAYERLLEIVCSVGGAFLFLRRLSLSRPAALLGGITFAGSGFMVAWLGFPQTRVA